MYVKKDCRSGIAEIDYSRDTLFGPIPMQATCRVRLTTVEQDGQSLRELTILGDVPDYLTRSAAIRVALEGRIEAGPVLERHAARKTGDERLSLLFENQHQRAMSS